MTDTKISELPLRSTVDPTDELLNLADGVNYRSPVSGILSLVEAGGGNGITVDTGQEYKTILLSDGSVKAIPADVAPPNPPTSLSIIVGLTSVNISWPMVIGAARYNIYRNGNLLNNTADLSLRDTTVVVGNTYEYRVSGVDQYGQVSPRSSPVSATINLLLNHAPTDVVITCWPTPIPTDGPAFIRVNAREIDVQNMASLLNVDAGALRATDDPSVWIITI